MRSAIRAPCCRRCAITGGASAPNASIRLSEAAALKWQAGVFLFTQNYEQNAVNNVAPFTFSPFINVPLAITLPDAELDDFGVGVYGQGTATIGKRFDLTAGVRVDNEQKDASLSTWVHPVDGTGYIYYPKGSLAGFMIDVRDVTWLYPSACPRSCFLNSRRCASVLSKSASR